MSTSSYLCARRIATGGMADVVLAAHQSLAGFEKLVVMKRILPRLATDNRFVRMFLDEARLAAALKHPSIVEIYDVLHRDGVYAAVMEYISGEDLRFVLHHVARVQTRIPIPLVCRIMADAADALHAAHTATDLDGKPRGIIHRDVSPSNIVVSYHGVTKLVDFGLAKANENNLYTRPGTLRGKLPYASPEQVQGVDLDARSDLFSLGTVLHEMLTSRRLFSGATQALIQQNVMERRIPPPSVYNPSVTPALDAIVLKLLERDPRARTASGAELRDALESLLDNGARAAQRQVGEWMRTVMDDRYRRRVVAERQVVEESRAVTEPPTLDGELPALLEEDANDRAATSLPSGSSLGSAGFVPPPPRATTTAPVETERVRRNRTMWISIGAAAGAVLAFGFGTFTFLMGRDAGQPPTLANTASAATEPSAAPALVAEPAPAAAQVGLLLYVIPTGTAVAIDGAALGQSAGPDGLLVPVPAGREIALALSKPGYRPHAASLTTPTTGTMPVYVTLFRDEPAEPELVAVAPERAAAPERRRAPQERGSRAAAAPEAEAAPALARVRVSFEPASASLAIDGVVRAQRSPVTAELDAGSHTLTVTAPGFEPLEKSIEVSGGTSYELAMHLSERPPAMGRVDVVSTPSGARVEIDGQHVGTTPIVGLMLPAGEPASVTLELDGYQPYTGKITPSEGQQRSLAPRLEATAPPPAARRPAASIVPAHEMQRVSGAMPHVNAKERDLPDSGRIGAKLCVDERGEVSSVSLLSKLRADLGEEIGNALRSWRYRPYHRDGEPAPVCFAVQFAIDVR
jgi:serine/threonine-protein kinase